MKTEPAIRPGAPSDAAAMAAIKNAWIDETPWMPRVHPADDVERHYREFVLPNRTVRVFDDGEVRGYLGLDKAEADVTSLFVATASRSGGVGKALLDDAKALMPGGLVLWTFEINEGARRFYAREGFREVDRTDGDNEENLPDILLRWRPE